MDKLIKDNEDKLPAEVKDEVQADVDALKKALESQDNEDEVKAAFDKLQESQSKLGEALYAQAQADQTAAGAEGEQSAADQDEDIVDAEVVDEDEDEKK